MIVVIGSGISGLIIGKKVNANLILEEQPLIGGVLAFDSIFGIEIPYILPITYKPFQLNNFEFKYKEYEINIVYRKYEYFHNKICEFCEELPKWLTFDSVKKIYIIENIPEFIYELSRNMKIVKEYPIRIDENKIITNKGNVYRFSKIYNTGSLKRISRLLGLDTSFLGHISAFTLLILAKRKENNKDWNVYLSGDSAETYAVVIRIDDVIKDFQLYYIYSFLRTNQKNMDIERILVDLKRRQIISPNEIVAFRSRLLSEAILFGHLNEKVPINMINCGRLGEWRNYSIDETILRAQNC
ncbi:hypothetical protein V6M85_10470 [Sulfolobus tengchongensis]|uniref:NAD(P)/FAD-dependent oxidoreductase n=1 Tax=Sulfolobus tengchongensis TaxID=207809 RepID=A0AAX4L0C5_9CREN